MILCFISRNLISILVTELMMGWENKSSVMTVEPWASDGFEVMPWGSEEKVDSDGSRFGSDGNRSELVDSLTKLDRELCGNITDDYLQVIWKVNVARVWVQKPNFIFQMQFSPPPCQLLFNKESFCSGKKIAKWNYFNNARNCLE